MGYLADLKSTASRAHPDPPWWDAPIKTCRWCNRAISAKSRRRRWHSACNLAYRVAHFAGAARWQVWKRDLGVCASCGGKSRDAWQADHIHPLHLVDRSLSWTKVVSYWGVGNLQTLCTACHDIKNAKEAAARGKVARIRRKRGLDKPIGLIPF